MSDLRCIKEIPTSGLLAYWLGESVAEEAAVEEHLMACPHCSARLEKFVRLGQGIRRATRAGQFHGIVSASFVDDLRDDGLRVREYRVQSGGSVACTVTPDDDLLVSRLQASLHGVQRLDLVFENLDSGFRQHLEDVAFDPDADEVILAPNISALRDADSSLQQMRLIAVQDGVEREIGTYTFNHTRFEPRD
jgi:hypothetical protein